MGLFVETALIGEYAPRKKAVGFCAWRFRPRKRREEMIEVIVPQGALVVAGSRAVSRGKGAEWGISLYTPVIVKYRDGKTGQKIRLEDWLRWPNTPAFCERRPPNGTGPLEAGRPRRGARAFPRLR